MLYDSTLGTEQQTAPFITVIII